MRKYNFLLIKPNEFNNVNISQGKKLFISLANSAIQIQYIRYAGPTNLFTTAFSVREQTVDCWNAYNKKYHTSVTIPQTLIFKIQSLKSHFTEAIYKPCLNALQAGGSAMFHK